MRTELQQWVATPGEPVSAADWNGWLLSLDKLMPDPVEKTRRTPPLDYPFQVNAALWDDPTALPAGRRWRVDVSPGCGNDAPATILYRRKDDPRGWKVPSPGWLPPGLPAPAKPAPALDYLDRSLLEAGGDEPPFLLVTTPEASAAAETPTDDFILWRGSRPSYFQQDEYLDKVLWIASVTLSADPLHAFPDNVTGPARGELAAKLPERFRLRAGRAPVNSAGGVAGGTVEIARLWLARDPKAKDVLAADEVLVQQRVYTHLQALIVAPGLSVSDGSILGDLTQEILDTALAAAAGQEFWSG